MSSLLAIGSLAFDSVETPSGKRDKALGGSANYFSVSASLFNPIRLVAVIGNDFPKPHLDTLRNRGVDLEGLQTADGPTFYWSGKYEDDLNEAITLDTQLNVFQNFDPVLPQSYLDSEIVFLGNIDPVLQLHVLKQVKKPAIVGLDSMNFWINGKYKELVNTLSQVDVLTINEMEAIQLSKKGNLVEAAETILGMGPRILLVKQGSYGCIMFRENSMFSAPALPMKTVVDPTGAGDSFAGGFFGYLAKSGASLDDDHLMRKAIVYGSVMASYAIEDFSFDRTMSLTDEEVEARYRTFQDLTHF